MTVTTDHIFKPHLKKQTLNKPQRGIRAVLSLLDPRAWLHLLRIVNYYNHTHVAQRRLLQTGDACTISPTASFANAGNIHLGQAAHIGANCSLWAGQTHGTIRAGDNLLLGPNVTITAANYDFHAGTPVTKQPMAEQPVTLGHDVWIGANAVILPGVSIGDGAIIGAGTVVTRSIPAGAVVAGSPAKAIGQRQVVVGPAITA